MHYDPICFKQRHICEKVCTSYECNVPNPFVCQKCDNRHSKNCEIIQYKKLVHQFHKRQGLFTKETLKYEERVQKTFKEMIKSLKAQFVKFREEYEATNITDNIDYIYDKLRKRNQKELRGNDIYRALKDEEHKGTKLVIKNQIQMRIQKQNIMNMHAKILQDLPPYYSLQRRLVHEDQKVSQGNALMDIQQKYVTKKRKQIIGILKKYFSFFQNHLGKQAYNLQLLYKATDHNFSAKQFHKRCDGIPNTVTIAKTQYGNIVIGYCTFPWESPQFWKYKEDNKNSCFLISPSMNLESRKFVPKKKQFSIGMHADYGPCFGDDFVIYDKANKSKNCWSNFPDVYTCESNPIAHNIQTINEFVGVEDHYQKFSLVEWQVYYVSYRKQDELERSFMREYKKIPY